MGQLEDKTAAVTARSRGLSRRVLSFADRAAASQSFLFETVGATGSDGAESASRTRVRNQRLRGGASEGCETLAVW